MKIGRFGLAMTIGLLLCAAQLAQADDGLVQSVGFRSLVTQHDKGCGCAPKVKADCGCEAKVTQNLGCKSKCRPSLRESIAVKLGDAFGRIDAALQKVFPCRQCGKCPSACGKTACQAKSPKQTKCGCGSEPQTYDVPVPMLDDPAEAVPSSDSDPFEDDEAESEDIISPMPDASFWPSKPTRVRQPERVAGETRLPLVFRPVNALPMDRVQ